MHEKKPKQADPVPRNITYAATVPDAVRPVTRSHAQNQMDVEELRRWSISNKL